MLPARIFLLIGVVFGAATEVLGGPVMSSWAHRRDEISTNDSRTRGLSRYAKKANIPREKICPLKSLRIIDLVQNRTTLT